MTPWQQRVFRRAYEVWEKTGDAPAAFEETDFSVREFESCLFIEGWKHTDRSATVTEDGMVLIDVAPDYLLLLNKHDLSVMKSCVDVAYDHKAVSIEEAVRRIGHDPKQYDCQFRNVNPLDAYFPESTPLPEESTAVCAPRRAEGLYGFRILDPCPPKVQWTWDPPSMTPWQQRVFRRAYEVWENGGVAPAAFEGTDFRVLEYESCLMIQGWKHTDRAKMLNENETGLLEIGGSHSLNMNKHDLSVVKSCVGLGYDPEVNSSERALRAIGHDPDQYDCQFSDVNPFSVYFPGDSPWPPETTLVCVPKQAAD